MENLVATVGPARELFGRDRFALRLQPARLGSQSLRDSDIRRP
jgi:hypothetical protein